MVAEVPLFLEDPIAFEGYEQIAMLGEISSYVEMKKMEKPKTKNNSHKSSGKRHQATVIKKKG